MTRSTTSSRSRHTEATVLESPAVDASMAAETILDTPAIATPALDADEFRRLRDIERLEGQWDDLRDALVAHLQLAESVLGVDRVAVTTVEREVLVVRAARGMEEGTFPRLHAPCERVVHSGELVSVEDARRDPELARHPLVVEQGLGTYVGVPLHGPSQRVIGALCVMAEEPLRPGREALERLRMVARLVERELGRAQEMFRVQARFERKSWFDGLTGLANAELLHRELDRARRRAASRGNQLAIVRLDVDGFTALNEALGRHACDDVLVEVAERLRRSSPQDALVARLRDDEFAVLLPEVASRDAADAAVDAMYHSLDEAFCIGGQEFRLTLSVGVGMYPRDATDEATLLDRAGAALRSVRQVSGRRRRFYTTAIRFDVARRFEIERRLRLALDQGTFRLAYQPKVDAATGRVVGFEALLRWDDPVLGSVSPGEFIPVAERAGLIVSIGEWVLRAACEQALAWQSADHPPVTVAVNVASQQLRDEHFIARVEGALEDSGLDPALLDLEVTESTLVDDTEAIIDRMRLLTERGVTFSIDDFGTGYSSLRYLRRLPIHCVKIDRAFVNEIEHSEGDAVIVRAVVGIARSMGLDVVAEGVETPAQAEVLRQHDVDILQGFFFGKPMPPDEASALL